MSDERSGTFDLDEAIAVLERTPAVLRGWLSRRNLEILRGLDLGPEQLALVGQHPELGRVNLAELLATWAVHDLGHIAQIARVMAKRYQATVGAWRAYLPVLDDREPAAGAGS